MTDEKLIAKLIAGHSDYGTREAAAKRLTELLGERNNLTLPKIKTDHVYPPIPVRDCDWVAYYDEQETGPLGSGKTEAAAILDLLENYDLPLEKHSQARVG